MEANAKSFFPDVSSSFLKLICIMCFIKVNAFYFLRELASHISYYPDSPWNRTLQVHWGHKINRRFWKNHKTIDVIDYHQKPKSNVGKFAFTKKTNKCKSVSNFTRILFKINLIPFYFLILEMFQTRKLMNVSALLKIVQSSYVNMFC